MIFFVIIKDNGVIFFFLFRIFWFDKLVWFENELNKVFEIIVLILVLVNFVVLFVSNFRLNVLGFLFFVLIWILKIFFFFLWEGRFIKNILLNLFFFNNLGGRFFILFVVVIINMGFVFFCIYVRSVLKIWDVVFLFVLFELLSLDKFFLILLIYSI